MYRTMLRIGDYGTRVNQGVAGALSRRATVHRTVALNGFESRSPAKEKTTPFGVVFLLVETTGLEPVTSCV